MAYNKTVFLPIEPNAAFDLVTQPDRLRRWCAITARVDLRLGGEFLWTVTPGNNAMGNVVALEPGKSLSYSWGWVSDPDLQPGASKVTITLEPAPGGTNVHFVHDGLTPSQEIDHAEGWDYFLGRLVEFANSGEATADPWNASPDNLDEIKSAYAALALAQLVLYRTSPAQLANATPCSEFNLQQLIDHQYGSMVGIAASLGIVAPEEPVDSFEKRLADITQKILETFGNRGLDGTLILNSRELPAKIVANILNMELLIHGIDIAKSTGQPVEVSEPLAEYVHGLTRQTVSPELRAAGGIFGPELPVGESADKVERLLAFAGRAN